MLPVATQRQAAGQTLTPEAPPVSRLGGDGAAEVLPEEPGTTAYPVARVMPEKEDGTDVDLVADRQTYVGGHITLDGSVVITSRDRRVEADHIEYDRETGELTATGHLLAVGGANGERIEASHGSFNLKTQTGRFYDVKGSVGLKTTGRRTVYTSGNPFIFTGRMVVKTGPESYDIFDGSVTSCQLPHPDWLLTAGLFSVDGEKARARNSVFRLVNVPLLYLPYVTHAVDTEGRQSGFLVPVVGQSSTKGLILGEQIYFAINRSTDLTVGAAYFSERGWSQMANFRYRGHDDDFIRAVYTGLLDRRVGAANQGGEDALISGRRDFDAHNRVVGDVEYLSSFTYRAAFTENFNQAVSSDVVSNVYGMHEANGYEVSARADRYQGLKRIPLITSEGLLVPGQQVRIFHAPSVDLSSVDRALGRSGLTWSFDGSAAGLKRVQPNFQTGGLVERIDIHPELAYALHGGGWNLRPSFAVRESYYNRSRAEQLNPNPVESSSGLNRADVELQLDARAPVIERTFTQGWVRRLLRTDFTHTVQPAFTYRYITGVDNFMRVLRFDDRDIASNTNEIEYGVTQRLFLQPRKTARACTAGEDATRLESPVLGNLAGSVPDGIGESAAVGAPCGTREWITWRVAQKYFFDPAFGGAVQTGRRNIFETTLNFSGIAFLTEPREISPLISRLRVRASEHVDFEWDFDLDTGAKRFTADNVFVDVHEGATFAGFSYARLNAPGRAYSEGISSSTSDFSQMRVLLGYGMPTKPGLSVAANAGLDLNVSSVQYGALETSYNWNCCGFSVEYRKYELGSVRNENAYRFNFTLANVGTAGNLKRAQRLF